MSKNHDLQGRRDAAFARGLGNQLPVYVERARNAELWDVEGRRYIDFGSGIAVLNTGHLHPKVQAAVAKQLDAFSHTCLMVTPYESPSNSPRSSTGSRRARRRRRPSS